MLSPAGCFNPPPDHPQVMHTLTDNEQVFEMSDPSFRIEMSWFVAMTTSGARGMLEEKVLSLLPSGAQEFKPKDVANSISSLKTTPLYLFCSTEAQSSVNIACAWVEALANSRQPSLVGSEAPFLKKVSELLENLLVFRSATPGEAPCFGKAAIARLIGEAGGKPAGKVSCDGLRVFSTYSWLLTDAQRTQVQEFVVAAAAAGGSSSSGSASSASAKAPGKRPATPAAKKSAASSSAEVNSTMALFRKRKKTT